MKKLFACLFMFVLLLSVAFALQIREGDEIIIEKQIDDNLYVTAGSVSVDAPINGDIMSFGGNIIINSQIVGNVHACGGEISINSAVDGDLMTGGGNINLNGDVNGDILAMGGNIGINGDITGDILAMGGNININGPVGGDVAITAGNLVINGVVEGNVLVKAEKIRLGKDALIKGDFNYTSSEVIFDENQIEGLVSGEKKKKIFIGKFPWLAWKIWTTLSLLLLAIVLVLIFPLTSDKLSQSIKENFWKNLLFGLITLVVVPVAAVLIAITIIGIPITIILMFAYVLALLFSVLISSLFVGRLIIKKSGKKLVIPMVIGLIVYAVLVSIPYIGGLVRLLAILLGLGAITLMIFSKKRPHKQKKVKRKR